MPFPFSVGNDHLQFQLDWVAQAPPMLPSVPSDPNSPKVLHPRNTHALGLRLDKVVSPPQGVDFRFAYEGLMFFRPQGTGVGPVGSTAGLDGMGHLHTNNPPTQPIPPDGRGAMWVRVFLGFRPRASGPAHVFATLQFLKRVRDEIPAGQTVEFSHVNASGLGEIEMDVPPSGDDGWRLGLARTTVLFKLA